MKILQLSAIFNYLSGAPLYIYELSRELVKLGHQVTISSNYGGVVWQKALEAGIKVIPYGVPAERYDIVHIHGEEAAGLCNQITSLIVATIHSQWQCSKVDHPKVRHYIYIRPELQHANGTLIYNPIDTSRFNTKNTTLPEKRTILFVGTIDAIRKQTLLTLVEQAERGDFKLIVVGPNFDSYLNHPRQNVEVLPPTWDIENYTKACTETAGIMLGRSTIEGWMCGKPGTIYQVDLTGAPKQTTLYQPPEDLTMFDSKVVAKQIEEVYANVLS